MWSLLKVCIYIETKLYWNK